MSKSFSPEKVYSVSMWMVSLLFATFLSGLGSLVIADLPKFDQDVNVYKLGGASAPTGINPEDRKRSLKLAELTRRRTEANIALQQASNAFDTANEAHRNWLRTREVTASSENAGNQDQELIERTRAMDALQQERIKARAAFSQVDQQIRQISNDADSDLEQKLNSPDAVAERKHNELKVFGMRLALTLPLLLIAAWLIMKKRKSPYWPLARGFVLFAASAFFFELVPYMPSYGGYVRYLVGIALSGAGSIYGIRWMQAYLLRRQAEEKRNEAERRSKLDKDGAIKKMEGGLCPGCDRSIPKAIGAERVNHCVHCGLKLFDVCKAKVEKVAPDGVHQVDCNTRKNAFYSHCPECGGSSATKQEPKKPALLPA